MNLDRLDFVDRNDVSRAPRPSAPGAKITPAQFISQVPVIRDADEIGERRQRERPQGRNPPVGAEENRGRQRANDRAFNRAQPDRETRRHSTPPAPSAPPIGPASKSGKKIVSRGATAPRRVIGNRTSRPESSSSLSRWSPDVSARKVARPNRRRNNFSSIFRT